MPPRKVCLTKKTKTAIRFLADEGKADTSEVAWVEALKVGKVEKATLYRAMTAYGMKWDLIKQDWYTRARRMNFVKTLFSTVRKIDSKLDQKAGLIE